MKLLFSFVLYWTANHHHIDKMHGGYVAKGLSAIVSSQLMKPLSNVIERPSKIQVLRSDNLPLCRLVMMERMRISS